MLINKDNCMSVRKKGSQDQCTHPRKNGDYCGIHARSSNVQRVDDMALVAKSSQLSRFQDSLPDRNRKKILIKQPLKRDKLFSSQLQVNGNSKSIISIREQESVVKIQKWCRGILTRIRIRDRNSCENKTDILSTPLIEIPLEYFFVFEENGRKFGFDIRTVNDMIENADGELKNPYTMQPISKSDMKRYYNRVRVLESIGYSTKYPNEVDISFETQAVSVLSKLDRLGYHIRPKIFLDLNFKNLQKLYLELEDIWNFRLGMSNSTKVRIIKYRPDGDVFVKKKQVSRMGRCDVNKQLVRNVLLRDIDRLITEGDHVHRETGALIVVMGLVHVSKEVWDSYPSIAEMVAH